MTDRLASYEYSHERTSLTINACWNLKKERIIFFYILYISFFEKFYEYYILFIDKYQVDSSKTEEIFQKFARNKNFRIFAAKIGNLIDK